MAERCIEICKVSDQKLWAIVRKTGLNATQEQCVSEVAMASNAMLTYGGYMPQTALLGYHPRELYDPENRGLCSVRGSRDNAECDGDRPPASPCC